MRVLDPGTRMNQRLMPEAQGVSSSTNEISGSRNTERTGGNSRSSLLCGASCKKGLRIFGRALLAVVTVGISEGIRKGVDLYTTRSVRRDGKKMGRLWETSSSSGSVNHGKGSSTPGSTENLSRLNQDATSEGTGSSVNYGTESSTPGSTENLSRLNQDATSEGTDSSVNHGIDSPTPGVTESLWISNQGEGTDSSVNHGIENPTPSATGGQWTFKDDITSGGISSFGKEQLSPRKSTDGPRFIFNQSPHKPSNDIVAEMSLKPGNNATGE